MGEWDRKALQQFLVEERREGQSVKAQYASAQSIVSQAGMAVVESSRCAVRAV